ncbi:MAG: NlpC/P60 family protein, partial [bacterium]
CSQLVREVFNQFDGRILPRTVYMLYTDGVEMHRNHLDFGDLVFFKTDHSAVSHVGIFTGEDQFLHASSSRGVIISSMSETYWAKRYVGARRILLKQRPDREP